MAGRNGREGRASKTSMELVGDREIVLARSFRAPARIVFAAWTAPEHVARWWAPKAFGVEAGEIKADVRVGGTYRYSAMREGKEIAAFSGEYREVEPPTRLVYTSVFEAMADAGPAIVTVTFEEADGQTRLVARELYPSAEARRMAVESGMEDGIHEVMDQLDELVGSLLS